MNDGLKTDIVEKLNEILFDLAPDVTTRPMYGGTVIELKKDDPKSRVGGIFVYSNYVSLELSHGVSFDDPKHVLEGNGKLRRHVKMHSLNDIKQKDCKAFLRQALSIA